MLAIYKKEIYAYLKSAVGYVFAGVYLAFYSYFFMTYNVAGDNADIGSLLENGVAVFILLVPILTMRLFAEEKHSKTSFVYLCAPLKTYQTVLGKYFAALSVFAVSSLIVPVSGAIMVFLKGQTAMEVMCVFSGYLLVGAVFIAAGMLMSSFAENQVISAILSFAVLLLMYFADLLIEAVGGTVFEGFIKLISVSYHYKNLLAGIFDVGAVVYFISLSALFVTFTILKTEQNTQNKRHRLGVFAVMCVVIFVFLNLFTENLSRKIPLKFDCTQNKMFTLSKETKEYLKTVDEDIKFYYFVSSGGESPYVMQVAEQYTRNCKNISFEIKDIIKNPVFAEKYKSDGENVSVGTVIVESGKRFKSVDPGSAVAINRNGNVSANLGFTLEKKLTNAVDFVLRDKNVTVRYVTGHNEADFSIPAQKLGDENISVKKLDIANENISPADTDMLVLFGLRDDLTKPEYEKVIGYLDNGGKVFIASNVGARCENVLKIAEQYGIYADDNCLVEGDSGKIIKNSNLYLAVEPVGEIFDNIRNTEPLVFPSAGSLTLKDTDGLKVSSLAKTSETAKAKEITADGLGRTLSEGVFDVAGMSENGKNGAKLIFSSTAQFISPDGDALKGILNSYSFVNREFFVQMVKYAVGGDGMYISIAPKSIMSRSLNLTLNQKFALIVIFMLIPIFVLVLGLIVWRKRKNL